jgi:hypothetical protein
MLMFAMLLAIPVFSLALVLRLDDPHAPAHAPTGPSGLPWLDSWLRRVRTWHAVMALGLTFLLYAALLERREPEPFLLFAALLVLGLFVRAWRQEFVTLMGLGDEAFPGRFDKPVWVFLMVVLPPLGVTAFRAFRKSYWIEPAPASVADPAAKPATFPDGF